MREITIQAIQEAVAKGLQEIHYQIRPDLQARLQEALQNEVAPLGRQALEMVLHNAATARAGIQPLCQDTGMVVIFVELGQEVCIRGGSLADALQDGVRQGVKAARLRHSMVDHPFKRTNTNDNTPAAIHYEIVPGDRLRLQILSKGSGSENASRLAMLLPAAGENGVADWVIKAVEENGPAACPPLLIGLGVGGSFDTVAGLAKKALLRPIGQPSADAGTAAFEARLLERINRLGIGPQGWGGSVTALTVAVETAPCHIASLPVAVNIECHSHRCTEVTL